MKNNKLFKFCVIALSIVLVACAGGSSDEAGCPVIEDRKINVVATTPMIGEFVSQVGGDNINLTVIMPSEADPHTYEPAPQDAGTIADADLVFYTGLKYEPAAVVKLLESSACSTSVLAEVGENVYPIEFKEGGHDNHGDHSEEGHDDHDEEEGHDDHDHGNLIHANYMQEDAEFDGYEFELGKTFDMGSGELSLSFGRDVVNAKFSDGHYVPRINPARNIYSLSYKQEDLLFKMTLKDVEKQNDFGEGETATDSYQMLNSRLTKSFNVGNGDLKVSLFANNLLDEVARNHSSFVKDEVPLPGRNYGLKFNLNF